MRVLVSLAVMCLGLGVSVAEAQQRPSTGRDTSRTQLPRAVAQEIVRLYNEPHAFRAFERAEITAAQTVDGNVSVIDGPLVIAGRVTGRVVAVNADLVFRPGARVDGDVLVVGGDLEGQRDADIGGEIRVYRPPLRFARDGDRIASAETAREADDDAWWRRWERRRATRTRSRLEVASAGAYNRVEGLPINLGPVIETRPAWGALRAEAFAVIRTGSSFRGDADDVGHNLRVAARTGSTAGVRVGATLFNVNAPVEAWQLNPLEYALSAFLARRDYRDLYGRHGASGHARLYDVRFGEIGVEYSHERWSTRESREPFSLFRRGAPWRPNPEVDAGRLHVLSAVARYDTRNDSERPWAGWYVQADVERGRGDLHTLGPTPPGTRANVPGPVAYTRGFIDARRYNRVGPGAQLNFRVVSGGWLGGDPLPLQRRLSVSGPGALPGYDFRTPLQPRDVGTCISADESALGPYLASRPALCDRILLGQAEYRGDLHFDFFGGFDWRDTDIHFRSDATWVLFADAGRGWLLGDSGGGLHFPSGSLPPPSTFRTDLGAGLDFGGLGVFVVKPLAEPHGPLNFLVRLRHRF